MFNTNSPTIKYIVVAILSIIVAGICYFLIKKFVFPMLAGMDSVKNSSGGSSDPTPNMNDGPAFKCDKYIVSDEANATATPNPHANKMMKCKKA